MTGKGSCPESGSIWRYQNFDCESPMVVRVFSLCCGRSNTASRSLALRVHPALRWLLPLSLIVVDAAFLYTNLVGDATSYLDLYVYPERVISYHTEAFVFYLSNTVQLMWENEARFLAFLIAVFSCALPHIKVISLIIVWFIPLSNKITSNALFVLDLISKWSFLDLFVLTMYGQALNITAIGAFFGSYDVNMSLLVRPGSFVFLGAVCYALLCSQIMIALHRATTDDGGHGGGGGAAAAADDDGADAGAGPRGRLFFDGSAAAAPLRAPSKSIAEVLVRSIGAPSLTSRLQPASALIDEALDPLQSAVRRASASFSHGGGGSFSHGSRSGSQSFLRDQDRDRVRGGSESGHRVESRSFQLAARGTSEPTLFGDPITAPMDLTTGSDGNGSMYDISFAKSPDKMDKMGGGEVGSENGNNGAAPPSSTMTAAVRRACAPCRMACGQGQLCARATELALAPLCCACGWWALPLQAWLRPRKWWYFMCCSKISTKIVIALVICTVGAMHIYAITADCFQFAYGGVLGETMLENYNNNVLDCGDDSFAVGNCTRIETYTVTRSIVAFTQAISVENYIAPEGFGDAYNGSFNPAIYFPELVVGLIVCAMPLVFLLALLLVWLAPSNLVCSCEVEQLPTVEHVEAFLTRNPGYTPPSAAAVVGAAEAEGGSDDDDDAEEDVEITVTDSRSVNESLDDVIDDPFDLNDVQHVIAAAAAAASKATAARVYVKSALLTLVHFATSWSATDVLCVQR